MFSISKKSKLPIIKDRLNKLITFTTYNSNKHEEESTEQLS